MLESPMVLCPFLHFVYLHIINGSGSLSLDVSMYLFTICWSNLLFLMRLMKMVLPSPSWSVFFDLLINKVNTSPVKISSFSFSGSISLICMNPEEPSKIIIIDLIVTRLPLPFLLLLSLPLCSSMMVFNFGF